jgi:hypothetical protein
MHTSGLPLISGPTQHSLLVRLGAKRIARDRPLATYEAFKRARLTAVHLGFRRPLSYVKPCARSFVKKRMTVSSHRQCT